MRKKLKKFVAAILVVTMLTTMFTIAPIAAEANSESPTTDTMGYSVNGNNELGDILANEIVEYQSQNDDADGSYVISEITVAENIATVTFSAEKNCTVLVAVYDENTDEMLASGRAEALANQSVATVALETDSMPQAFVLRGFMLSDGNAPLSEAYHSEMYTTDMQQLLQSTVDDYDSEKVLNIDDDPSTNFMVYSDEVKKFDCNDTVNTIEKADDNGDTYVFTNADDRLKGLKTGDIFVCDDNPQNPVIFKVGEISVDGDTVTITSTETSLEQVFDCVKIESTASLEDSEVDESTGSRGITYINSGKTDEESNNKKNVSSVGAAYDDNGSVGAVDIEKEAEYDKEFKFSNDGVEDEDSDEDDGWAKFDGEFKGNIGIRGSISVDIYLTLKGKKAVSLVLTAGVYYKTTISGTFEINPKLPDIKIPVLGNALKVKLTFGLIVRVKGEFEFVVESSFKVGFGYTSGGGFKNLSQKPKINYEMSLEGEVFVGFTVDITAVVIDDEIGEVGYGAEIGFDITASFTRLNIDVEGVTVNHDCKKCVSGDISFVIELNPIVKIGGKDMLKKLVPDIDFTTTLKWDLPSWYFSFTHGDFGFDICRYANVSFNIKVLKDGQPVENADVMDTYNGVYIGKTNFAGILNVTLNGNETGLYQLYADKDDSKAAVTIRLEDFDDISVIEDQKWKSFKSADSYKGGYLEIELSEKNVPQPTVEPTTQPEETEPPVTEPQIEVLDSGKCGDDITYEYLSDGTLKLNGTGAMYDYEWGSAPWRQYKDKIISAEISQGITSIGDYSLNSCYYLNSLTLPNSVTSIGNSAFSSCGSLTSVTIPDSVTSIGNYAFGFCNNLKNVIIPNSVTSIGNSAFSGCNGLTSITIPNSVTSIGEEAFYNCSQLTTIDFSNADSLSIIGKRAFMDCSKLTEVDLSNADSLTVIGNSAFAYCNNLESAIISDSVTSIGEHAFRNCTNMTRVKFPNQLKIIGYAAFANCALINVDLSNASNLTSIDEYAFADCYELVNVDLSNARSLTSIGSYAFAFCKELTSITIPDSVTKINYNAFGGCSNLRSVTLSKNTSVDLYAFTNCSPDLVFHYYEDDNTASLSKPVSASVSAQNDTIVTREVEYSDETAYAYYIIAVVKDPNAEDLLSADNLIYITQVTADEKGNISSNLAIPSDNTDYDVVLCGPGRLSVKNRLIGDVNFDGEIRIDDVTIIQKYIADLITLSKDLRTAADCDGNGYINIQDATLIQRYLAGFETDSKIGENINNG